MLYATIDDLPREGWRWRHFRPQELACRCGGRFCRGEYFHDPAFLDAMDALREAAGRPVSINSGRRCPQHNAAVGGAPLSMHARTIAADVVVAGWDDEAKRRLLESAYALGFGGLGFGRSFFHLDRRPLKPTGRPAEWDYQKGGRARWKALLR
ncbi:MAG TPA: D-Ala-D-Ala carboxypeptidase family metallohydrolase [Caulobacteraceae bacterium]|nr:D-Ala-D-Ala carboxypeptidase family metallohydrolase [Caulobacteraceae bacterium]